MGVLAILVPILPGLIWLVIFYRTDRYQPEPKRLVALTFVLGIFSIVPAFIGERLAERIYPYLHEIEVAAAAPLGALTSPVPLFIGCFLVIGPCEEIAKFLAVRLFVYRHRAFDEPIDGMVYAAAAALGFASLENLFYVTDFHTGEIRWGLLGVRAFLALPGHVLFSATWGYALGRKRFDPSYRVWPMVLAAAGLHGLYDFLLMYPPARPVIILYGALMVPVLLRQIRLLREDSPFAPGAQLVPVAVAVAVPVTPPEPGGSAGGGEPGAGAT